MQISCQLLLRALQGLQKLSSSVFSPHPCLFKRGSCGVPREKTELMSHEGQMEQGVYSCRRCWSCRHAPVSTERPLLPVKSWPRAGKLWEYRSVCLLEPGKDMAAASASRWKGTRSHLAFHLTPGGWGLRESRRALLVSCHSTLLLLRLCASHLPGSSPD